MRETLEAIAAVSAVEHVATPAPEQRTIGRRVAAAAMALGLMGATTACEQYFPNAETSGYEGPIGGALGGEMIFDPSDVARLGGTGTGTESDPYLLEDLNVTGGLRISCGCGLPDWNGKHLVINNSALRDEGYGDIPYQQGGQDENVVWLRNDGPYTTFSSVVIGPNVHSNGVYDASDGGFIRGLLAQTSFTLRDSEVYGSATNVSMNTELNMPHTYIEDNYIWGNYIHCPAGPDPHCEHTNGINGNAHASNVTIKHNKLDGAVINGRSDGDATYGTSAYDDGNISYIQNWTFENNYYKNYDTFIFSNTDQSRVRGPWVIKYNVLTDTSSKAKVITRTPTDGQGTNFNGDGTGQYGEGQVVY